MLLPLFLQIVLWTACLAANGGAIEGNQYLQRETVSIPLEMISPPKLWLAQHACRARSAWIILPNVVRTFPQGNLKAFTGVHPTPDFVDELALAICEHHTALEHLCLQQQFNAWSVITSSLLQQPHAQSLRAFPVSAPAVQQ